MPYNTIGVGGGNRAALHQQWQFVRLLEGQNKWPRSSIEPANLRPSLAISLALFFSFFFILLLPSAPARDPLINTSSLRCIERISGTRETIYWPTAAAAAAAAWQLRWSEIKGWNTRVSGWCAAVFFFFGAEISRGWSVFFLFSWGWLLCNLKFFFFAGGVACVNG